ncbi:MAG TPA: MBL fold metallo-hydrolase [Casimicrobiaceae bacterium]|nr:MBL fold metallo-hydrolase [Casimicrobiaceae bacterium]
MIPSTAKDPTRPSLPPQLHVFVRDWLSSNNVLLKSAAGNVLIDTGHGRHAPLMLALLASRQGLDGAGLARIVNTHCHNDHMGGNAAVARAYGCAIAVPEGEAPLVERWDTKALWIEAAGGYAERFRADETIAPGSAHVWGDLEWRALAAPGHDMGALVFYNAPHRILISGDALWENGFGIVMPRAIDPAALPAARATLESIAALDIDVVIPGHGEPFTDVKDALGRAFSRIAAFEADDARAARHAVKALLTFTLLDRRRLSLAELPPFIEQTSILTDINARCFGFTNEDFAAWLAAEVQKAGAAQLRDGTLTPR